MYTELITDSLFAGGFTDCIHAYAKKNSTTTGRVIR